MEKLLNLGFVLSASVDRVDQGWNFNITQNRTSSKVLYAFVFSGEDGDERVVYVGHTRKSFENRMYGYQRGNGVAVNNRIHKAINEQLNHNGTVLVYCLPNRQEMMIQGVPVDLAAGLEYGLISFYAEYNHERGHTPLLNIAGNLYWRQAFEAPQDEKTAIQLEREEENDDNALPSASMANNKFGDESKDNRPSFQFSLTERTYWPLGSINIPVQLEHFFGEHGGTVDVMLMAGNSNPVFIQASINRMANGNRSPRLLFQGEHGPTYKMWKQQNHVSGDVVQVLISNQNSICIV
jgi:hypothetical protein